MKRHQDSKRHTGTMYWYSNTKCTSTKCWYEYASTELDVVRERDRYLGADLQNLICSSERDSEYELPMAIWP